jgi:uncharacterized membrane protein
MSRNWHQKHTDGLTFGQRLADQVASFMGSWPFIIGQSVIILIWVAINIIGFIYKWDPYPFILLNLVFSVQAAYAAPIIMMSQNRQADRDRIQATEDFEVNKAAKVEIEALQIVLTRIENEKLDEILKLVQDKCDF